MKIWCLVKSKLTVFALCGAFLFPCVSAEDAQFSPAPITAPVTTPAGSTAASKPADSAPQAAPAALSTVAWIFSSPIVWTLIVMAFLRLEAAIQAKTKVDVSVGNGLAHTVYGILKDKGFIAPGQFTAAMDQFWAELDRQSQEHYGTATTPAVQDAAHATFAQLLNSHGQPTALRAAVNPGQFPVVKNV